MYYLINKRREDMKKKLLIGIAIAILIIVGGYLIFNETRYNNITKIETKIVNNATLIEKNDIRLFMKCVKSKENVTSSAFAIDAIGKDISNNVTIFYKDGSSSSFLMGLDTLHNQLSYQEDIKATTVCTLSNKNSEKILNLLSKN